MPLARMAMYAKGVEIYLAPTADGRERWQATLQHIAIEGRCFVLGCNQYATRSQYPDDLEIADELESWPERLCRGGSAIYSPSGECLAGPCYDEEGILVADLDPARDHSWKVRFRRGRPLRAAGRLPPRGGRASSTARRVSPRRLMVCAQTTSRRSRAGFSGGRLPCSARVRRHS